MSHQPNNGVTLNGTLLPDDVVPNRTDPANTASNGPAALNEQTLGDYRSERSITRERAEEARPYDLVILSSFGGPEGQEDVIPFLRNVTAGRSIPDERLEEVATHYRANGGVSPITSRTVPCSPHCSRRSPNAARTSRSLGRTATGSPT